MIEVIIIITAFTNPPYYFDRRIHNLGMLGIPGKIHAETAVLSTRIIDEIRYNGVDIRKKIINNLNKDNSTIIDFACGVGLSTAPNSIGIDTSPEMLKVANKINNKNKNFILANAETFKSNKKLDIATCMFAFHEMPLEAQINVRENMILNAHKRVIIMDIASNYKPKKIMLSGEPYLLDYINNIDYVLKNFKKNIIIPNHLHLWQLDL